MGKSTQITNEIKQALSKFFKQDKEGRWLFVLGNSRLDFETEYFFEKFTKFGIKLYHINGNTRINVVAKVEYFPQYDDYAVYTEGWQYIEHFKLPKEVIQNECTRVN